MLYLPLEFGEITMDRIVDSGAFINAMSWSDYNLIKMNSNNCVIKKYQQPPFKIQCGQSSPRTTNSHSGYTIQHRNLHVHGHLRHPLKDVFPHNRVELHAKSSSGARHSERKHQLPARRNNASHDR